MKSSARASDRTLHCNPRRRPITGVPPRPGLERKYDSESGLVYSELEIRVNRRPYSDWINEPKTPALVKKPRPSAYGARSLADMAKAKVATQFQNLTPDHFAVVPWTIAEKIWKQLVASRGETFHAWRILAASYPGESEFGQPDHRYLLDIKRPLLPLKDYLAAITSPEFNWLTCLRLSPKQMTTVDLVSIHTVTNLAVLDLSDGKVTIDNNMSPLDERVMRSWAELAACGKAFQHLRVMLCGWQENLADWIFRYTDCFPSLCYIILTDCPKMHQRNRGDWEAASQAAGWDARHAKRSAKSLRPIIGNQDFHYGSVSGCYYDSLELFHSLAHARRPNLVARLPLLEVWLGSPRQWSHVIDDFPSTRTIFFDNVRTRAWAEREGPSQLGGGDKVKRLRNHDLASQGSTSPPAKRGPTGRPMMRSTVPSVVDMLNEFQSR